MIIMRDDAMAQSNRIVWIDWMKALAMYFIIAGHCWVPYNQYIYVFSVPCFFIISGYLSHKESTVSIFWTKLLFNMVIPLCIYLIISLCFYNLQMYANGLFNLNNLYQGPILSIIGMQGQNYSAGGLQALWFVYTLCICKIIFQFLPKNISWPSLALTLLFLFGCIWINNNGIIVYNSIVNVLIAFPFFFVGSILRKYSSLLNRNNILIEVIALFTAIIVTIICGKCNGDVFLYKCSYGNNIFLCLIGGISGTVFVYIISKWCTLLFKCLNMSVLGGGTMNMLGIHPILIIIFNNIFRLHGWTIYIESLIVFLLFIPINKIVKKHFPLAYGLYRR